MFIFTRTSSRRGHIWETAAPISPFDNYLSQVKVERTAEPPLPSGISLSAFTVLYFTLRRILLLR